MGHEQIEIDKQYKDMEHFKTKPR